MSTYQSVLYKTKMDIDPILVDLYVIEVTKRTKSYLFMNFDHSSSGYETNTFPTIT